MWIPEPVGHLSFPLLHVPSIGSHWLGRFSFSFVSLGKTHLGCTAVPLSPVWKKNVLEAHHPSLASSPPASLSLSLPSSMLLRCRTGLGSNHFPVCDLGWVLVPQLSNWDNKLSHWILAMITRSNVLRSLAHST